jgi:hypothetical protein
MAEPSRVSAVKMKAITEEEAIKVMVGGDTYE